MRNQAVTPHYLLYFLCCCRNREDRLYVHEPLCNIGPRHPRGLSANWERLMQGTHLLYWLANYYSCHSQYREGKSSFTAVSMQNIEFILVFLFITYGIILT